MASLLMQNVCVLLRATTLTIPTKDTFEQDQSRKFEKRAPQGRSLNSIVNLELCKNTYDYLSITRLFQYRQVSYRADSEQARQNPPHRDALPSDQ